MNHLTRQTDSLVPSFGWRVALPQTSRLANPKKAPFVRNVSVSHLLRECGELASQESRHYDLPKLDVAVLRTIIRQCTNTVVDAIQGEAGRRGTIRWTRMA